MNFINDLSTVFISIPNWLLIFTLSILGGIIWCFEKRIGFQLLYLTFFSFCIAMVALLFFPPITLNNEQLPFQIEPFLQMIAVVSFYYIYGNTSKARLFVYFLLPFIAGSLFYLIFPLHILTVINSILVGGFIIFTFRRSQDWLGGLPEPLLFSFTILLPIFFAILFYPTNEGILYSGILLGSGLGFLLELLKIRFTYVSLTFLKRILVFLIGALGLILIFLVESLINIHPLSTFLFGFLIGAWICFFVPALFVSLKIYSVQKRQNVF